jgi:hypothetical protein
VGRFKDFLGIPDVEPSEYTLEERKLFATNARIGWTTAACGLFGVPAIAFWAGGVACHAHAGWAGFLAYYGGDLLAAVAAAAAGAFFGFIFGLPRTLDPERRTELVQAAAQQKDPMVAAHAAMAANTNLERVSDWLTTLLIGATLVQIKEIVGWVGGLGQKIIDSGTPANNAVVPIIIVFYFALSFVGFYMITRTYLTFALAQTLGMLTGKSGRNGQEGPGVTSEPKDQKTRDQPAPSSDQGATS